MDPSKQTNNKLRWSADVDGVAFKLYIPKWRVPSPWPVGLVVILHEKTMSLPASQLAGSPGLERPIFAVVDKVRELTETVRYRPSGPDDTWEIGEPYVPYALLSAPPPEQLHLEVRWDRRQGTWTDD
jgi:hypothetical protein